MVESEHAQTERLREQASLEGDHWSGMTEGFRADPHRSDDPLLELLGRRVERRHSLIDVGAGAGRMALPLALRCRWVTAVEPSPSMGRALLEEASRHGVSNVSLVPERWEEAVVEPADLVLCCHVIYTVREIDAFIRKLEAHARERAWVVMFRDPPQHGIYGLWARVHGEERLPLPGFSHLEEVLGEMGISARTEELPSSEPGVFDSQEDAWRQMRERLFLREGSAKDRLLGQALREETEAVEGGWRLRGARPMRPLLAWWQPPQPTA